MANKNRFTGDEGKFIPESEADKWIKNYQDKNPGKVKAVFFGEKIIKEILNEPKAVGIRFYFAEKDDGTSTLVLVGADKEVNDIKKRDRQVDDSFKSESLKSSGDGGGNSGMADEGVICPPICSNT